MPRVTERKKILDCLKKSYKETKYIFEKHIQLLNNLKDCDEDEDTRKMYQEIIDQCKDYLENGTYSKKMIKEIQKNRYLHKGQNNKYKFVHRARKLALITHEADDATFLNLFRMDRESFEVLYEMVESHPEYSFSEKSPQIDVKLQLGIALEKLGSYGNGVSYDRISTYSGIGKGTLNTILIVFLK